MQSHDHAVKVLNGLIQTTLDSANGYREAAQHIDRSDCKALFTERASRRESLAGRLQAEVRTFGGEPEMDQSMLGKIHNKFVELKNAVTGDSDKAVVDEVERGEDIIKGRYARALDDHDLPVSARDLIQQAYGAIKSDHDDISRLKHQMH
jgi:uncharacterized protein (TIGR02284 family)